MNYYEHLALCNRLNFLDKKKPSDRRTEKATREPYYLTIQTNIGTFN